LRADLRQPTPGIGACVATITTANTLKPLFMPPLNSSTRGARSSERGQNVARYSGRAIRAHVRICGHRNAVYISSCPLR